MSSKYREIVGAVHIHTKYSDGTKTIPEIAELANQVELDFLMVSDHMTLRPLKDGLEGYYHDTAVIIGYEINDADDKNHYLAFDIYSELPADLKAQEYVRKLKDRGGLGIIAHPDEIRDKMAKYPSYPWTAWDAEGFDGIEIWNHMSQWMENLSRWNKLKLAFMPRRSLSSPTEMILRKWDQLNFERPVVGIGSIDVHGFPYKLGPIRVTIFPYKVQFKAIRTHLLIDPATGHEFDEIKSEIYKALRKCRAFTSNYRWGDARGSEFWIENKDGRAGCGDAIDLDSNTVFRISLPQSAVITIIRNGEKYAEGVGKTFEHRIIDTGIYRAEIYVGSKGWIFTNHIRIK